MKTVRGSTTLEARGGHVGEAWQATGRAVCSIEKMSTHAIVGDIKR